MRSALLRIWLQLFGRLPLRVLHALGTACGWLLALIPNRRCYVASINLARCFPAMEAAAGKRLLQQSLVQFGKCAVELPLLWTTDVATIQALVKEVIGEQQLRDALAQGKGTILAMPHLGAWELASLYCSMHYRLTVLYAPPRVAVLDEPMRAARERFGARLLPANTSGVRALCRALHRGELVGILPDQVPGEDHGATYAEFFGIPARTMVLISRLARQTTAPVIFVYAERLPAGAGYRLHFNAGPAVIASHDLQASTSALNHEIERAASLIPAQYQWAYKRFRGQKPGQPSLYKRRPPTEHRRA